MKTPTFTVVGKSVHLGVFPIKNPKKSHCCKGAVLTVVFIKIYLHKLKSLPSVCESWCNGLAHKLINGFERDLVSRGSLTPGVSSSSLFSVSWPLNRLKSVKTVKIGVFWPYLVFNGLAHELMNGF